MKPIEDLGAKINHCNEINENTNFFCNIGQDHSMTFNQCLSIVQQFQTIRFIQMMSLTFGLFTQVSGSGPHGPLVIIYLYYKINLLVLSVLSAKENKV